MKVDEKKKKKKVSTIEQLLVAGFKWHGQNKKTRKLGPVRVVTFVMRFFYFFSKYEWNVIDGIYKVERSLKLFYGKVKKFYFIVVFFLFE
jgi:hypothetical protein